MHMAEVSICYGMTETSPVSTQTRTDDPLELRVGTVGRVGPHVEVKVVDPESGLRSSSAAQPGELCTRGYSVMLGYWDEPEKTARGDRRAPAGCTPATWRRWTTTATSRSSGGSRTWSSAAGRTSTRASSRSSSTCTPTCSTSRSSASPTRSTARSCAPGSGCARARRSRPTRCARSAASAIAHYKVPRYVMFVDEFPMTVTGKVQKYKMRETTIEQLGLTVEAAR